MQTLIFAHRGASGKAPENTMAAFKLAVDHGADGIELDVQMSNDGHLVVIHDETIDRTTDGTGWVCELSLEQLRSVRAGHRSKIYKREKIPLLSEVLELLQPTKMELNIELKNNLIPYEGLEEKLINLISKYGMEKRTVISSFNHNSIAKLSIICPEIEKAILYEMGIFEPWEYAKKVGAQSIHPHFHNSSRSIVDRMHKEGMSVRPWTVNTDTEFMEMLEMDVDAVITNYPLKMKRILENYYKAL
ncbi:glycerophosphodiester phosphodiesterase [Aquibacillus halophilus]|uniref:Glycerophosphodiester phosphodiesterase n=1 Tax=Aquibacillus halophilus TaxID=930132 RepID=A0A6A8D767_9BACI|nr:glycerophosphodiester phosphodiesterase [Aquibacillus halophilus]MRH41120.1 glycerophosphodiester phosphodiesterase [Aquibacillus halophilus]